MNTVKKTKSTAKNKKSQSPAAFLFLSGLAATVLVFLIIMSILACHYKYSIRRAQQRNTQQFFTAYRAEIMSLTKKVNDLEERLDLLENRGMEWPATPPPTGTPEIVQ